MTEDQIRTLVEALRFYAKEETWQDTLLFEAPPESVNPGAQEWEYAPIHSDRGKRARVALSLAGEAS